MTMRTNQVTEMTRASLLARPWRSQPLRYLLVGGFNTLWAYGVFLALYALLVRHVHYIAALAAITVVNVTTSFVTQRLLVFRSRGQILVEYARFYGVYALPIAFGFVAFPFCKEVLHLRWYVAQAAITVVTIIGGYFGHKLISFAPAKKRREVAKGAKIDAKKRQRRKQDENGRVPMRAPCCQRAT